MNSSMLSSANTMGQLQKKIDGVTNNIANSNTAGYKRRESTFSSLLHQQVNNQPVPQNSIGRTTPTGLRVGTGAGIAQTALRMEPGTIKETGRELDFALTNKDVFFQVEHNQMGTTETQYTRDGSFYLSEDPEAAGTWRLVTSEGDFLLGEDGERLSVPAGARDFSLQADGTLTADLNGSEVEIGRMELAQITKPQLLEGVGNNNFRLPDLGALGYEEADIVENVFGREDVLMQGSLEQSNVDMGQELTELLNAQRHYSFNARAVSQGDQMMGLINGLRS